MSTPHRQCHYLNERGQQCDEWFAAVDTNKLCARHREIITPNGRLNEQTTPKYIDLVNDERAYCYHFLDGTAQNQSKELIFEFKDDEEGTIFEKLDAHIAFIEKVLEDVKARMHSARAVKSEKLDELTEEERKKLRSQKIDKVFKQKEPKEKAPTFKADPIGFLARKQGMSKTDASNLLLMDEDALLEKFARAKLAKKEKEEKEK
jgi:hypothetical protein